MYKQNLYKSSEFAKAALKIRIITDQMDVLLHAITY